MTNAFDELLASISDETDRKALENLGEKYKEVKDGRLRQSEFSRKMNELKVDKDKFDSEKERIEGDLSKLQEWRSWRTNNWDETLGMTKAEAEKVKKVEELNAELEVLKTAQEAGMTFDEVSQFIDKELTKKNVATREYIEKELRPKMVDSDFYKKDVDEKMSRLANGMEYLYVKTVPLVFSHKDEFGEILDPSELIKYANENGFKEIPKAYDAMIAPKRAEILAKKTEEAIKKAKEDGRAEARKEQAMGPDGRLPVDSGAPIRGHLETRLRTPKDKQDQEIPEDVKLGSGVTASLVAERFRKDLAEGKVLQS